MNEKLPMSDADALFPQVRGFIEFEALMAQARQVLSESAGKTWSDTEDHDPGITLLQAMAYNTSDLGYRLSLPLADLLTPAPQKQVAPGGIFPLEFGPQRALTCGPISEEDYRRALLDLRGGPAQAGWFLFQNAQLVREPEAQRYEYWYSAEERTYSFSKPAQGAATRLTLRGNYVLYLQPTREGEGNRSASQAVLDVFLRDHRNLGEAVSRIVWLQPQDLQVQAEIELDEAALARTSVAAILAAVYTAVQDYVTPPVQRCSTADLQARGWRNEDIYQGPYLRHGWIPQLPPVLQQGEAVTINLAPLVNALLAIDGVKRIRSLGSGQGHAGSPWIWTGRPGHYPRLWGARPVELLARGQAVRLVAHGMDCQASADEIARHLAPPARVDNPPVTLPYGRWRNPAIYRPVTSRIPPCYGLSNPRPTPEQAQLHQFLLPFEQLLANACKQLALLPNSLAFDREPGDVVWGVQWPFQQPGASNAVFRNDSAPLQNLLEHYSHDLDKELSCVNYLLGYFGGRVAPRIFAIAPAQFLASQQGYLRRLSELGYHRANVRIDKVSALQQRIAARLGWGGAEVFNANAPLGSLPFYLVEHRALLPIRPDPLYDTLQTPLSIRRGSLNGAACLDIFWPPHHAKALLRVGQLVDLVLTVDGEAQTIRGLLIARVGTRGVNEHYFSLQIAASVALERYQAAILNPANKVQWRNCSYWLKDPDFPLVYAVDQSGLAPDERRLTASPRSPFPAFAGVGSLLAIQASPVREDAAKPAKAARALLHAEVTQADSLGNQLVVKRVSGGAFPSSENSSKYFWHFDRQEGRVTDDFSFVISAVFDRDKLNKLAADPYAAKEWIESVVLDELPAHLSVVMHWLPSDLFKSFAISYQAWQNNGTPLGADAYSLMALLTLGGLPAEAGGIGNLHIATPQQQQDVMGQNGDQWHAETLVKEGLFYVPPKVDD